MKTGERLDLACSVAGCPRRKKYIVQDGDEYVPEGTVVIKMKCPWHDDGDFYSEQYYDKDGNELFWQPNDL